MHRRCVLAVVAISALALACLKYCSDSSKVAEPAPRIAHSGIVGGEDGPTGSASAVPSQLRVNGAPLSHGALFAKTALNRVLASPDLWVVFINGKRSNDPELLFAATLAADFCAGIGLPDGDVFPGVSDAAGRRRAAITALRKRCGHWGALSYAASVKLRKSAHQRMAAYRPELPFEVLARTGDVMAARRQAINILMSGDLLALQTLRIAELFPRAGLEGVESGEFWAVVGCELGLDCGPDSLLAISTCARLNMCGDSFSSAYFDAWREEVDDQKLYQLRDLVHRVAVAIASGHLDTVGISAE